MYKKSVYLHHEMQSEYDHIFACAWWKDSTWLSMEWRFIETAFCDYVNIHFTPEGLLCLSCISALTC